MPNTFLDNRDERFIPTVEDLLQVGLSDDGWPLASLSELVPEVLTRYRKFDMVPYTGEEIFVRDQVLGLLRKAQDRLERIRPGYRLLVCYGYRHPEVQRKYFEARHAHTRANARDSGERTTPKRMIERTHLQVAFPEVAGHPTGGAVDVTLIDELGRELDMGCDIACYDEPEKCFTYAKTPTLAQYANRLVLRELMMSVGFAPFNGEWWHFSYGDREWAYFYGSEYALYGEIDFRCDAK